MIYGLFFKQKIYFISLLAYVLFLFAEVATKLSLKGKKLGSQSSAPVSATTGDKSVLVSASWKKNDTANLTPGSEVVREKPKPISAAFLFSSAKKKIEGDGPLYQTPTPSVGKMRATPLSAAFLFGSCKRNLREDISFEKEQTIILADSSDDDDVKPCHIEESLCGEGDEEELFYSVDGSVHNSSEMVQESLEEFALIRKWLQDAQSPDNSCQEQLSNSPIGNRLAAKYVSPTLSSSPDVSIIGFPLPAKKSNAEVIVLSSGAESEDEFEKCNFPTYIINFRNIY